MKNFEVEDDLVEFVWQGACPQPFESLTFSEALRRVLNKQNMTPVANPISITDGFSDELIIEDVHTARLVRALGEPMVSPIIKSLPSADEMLAELDSMNTEELQRLKNYKVKRRYRKPSPNPRDWISKIPELSSNVKAFSNAKTFHWQDLCDHFNIDKGVDSARRALGRWVHSNHPEWPAVPEPN